MTPQFLIATLACALPLQDAPVEPAATAEAAPATEPEAPLGPLTSVLVLEPDVRNPRGPVHVDTLEQRIALGTFTAPAEGDTLELADGRSLTWKRLESADGSYADAALRGGWVYARVESERARVVVLEAAGHSFVLVDGEPRYGDPYALGITNAPILLREGGSDLLFKVGRGRLTATLSEPPARAYVDVRDVTLPDVVRGTSERSQAAALVVNASAEETIDLLVHSALEVGEEVAFLSTQRIVRMHPLEARKVKLPLPLSFEVQDGMTEIGLRLTLNQIDPEDTEHQLPIHVAHTKLRVREPHETYKVTFESQIDGSVQYYAVNPAARDDASPPNFGLVLSLHGAGVEATGQASSYAPKNWCHIVAPTNRRPYGFDWEDWGRQDAMEALFDSVRRLRVDPGRLYLTGHSMGGHGAWNLGAHHPSLFAAVAPSAGWSDFWSYGGAWEPNRESAAERTLARAANGSRTPLLLENLASLGVYVLHGEKDDNVPVTQSRTLRDQLATFHKGYEYHEEPGAGHWWGAQCVDWPALFDFLLRHRATPDGLVREISFRTFNPAVSNRMKWLSIEGQANPLKLSQIDAILHPERRTFEMRTRNVSQFRIDLVQLASSVLGQPPILEKEQPFHVDVDQQNIEITWPPGATLLRMRRNLNDGSWNALGAIDDFEKGVHRYGPFKTAFDKRMTFVYGTQGSPEENAWAFQKARLDAETWRYRANGTVELVPDVEFVAERQPERNVIVYGHSQMVAGFRGLIATGEFDVTREGLRIGRRKLERDDLALLLVFPRKGSTGASVGLVAGTGLAGLRTTNHLPYFTSGVAYPDWTVLSADMLTEGGAGVLAAGFFGSDWTVDSGQAGWRDDE